ncbi:sugar phosphate isomerase/epimerase family protein [Pseudonocardia sp. CA-107938]|uniref:sugar phosphate isomerase/epimerase family protein n=1 Tax=Pseudonocardia sp. CA-107938 TaxID=3240021 RepID=UPI003D8D5B2D
MVELVASHYTLTGAGFAEPPRHGFAERCRAAADAGFAGIGVHVDELDRTPPADMRAVLDATGLRVVEIEFLGGWALDGPDTALVERIEAVADAVGGRHVSTGEFRAGDLDRTAAAQRLRELADRLAARGLLLALEAFPWSALDGPAAAADLLRLASTAGAGLMVDVWQFWNGGGDPGMLADVPVAAVQLNDGPYVRPATPAEYLHHARAARQLPGTGELDVVGLVRAAAAAGFTGPWSVEVNTPQLRALPAAEAARQAASTARAVLDEALG